MLINKNRAGVLAIFSEVIKIIVLNWYSLIYIKMLWTFVGEPAFSKHVQQFHRALTEHYSQRGKHLQDPAEMEAFCDQHAPGLFGQLNKSMVNDEKEKPFKKRLEIQKTRVVSMLHNLSFFCNQVQVTYICAFCSYGKLQCCCHLFFLF